MRELTEYARKRLAGITPVLQKVAAGDFSESINIPEKSDEFTEHLDALNLMIRDFKKMVCEIEENSYKIKRQNKELAKTTAELASGYIATAHSKALKRN